MLWVRYTVFVLLVIFVALSVAANVLPLYRFSSPSAEGTLDASAHVYVHTSTYYLWYHEVQIAADVVSNTVDLPEFGGSLTMPAKMKLFMRVLAANMRNSDADLAKDDGPASFSHIDATCSAVGQELMAASAMSVASTVLGGCTLFVVAWGRGPSDVCLVPGWVAFTLTALAAICALVAVALTAHMRVNALCGSFALSRQGYTFASGFPVLCAAFGGYVLTAMIQAVCPMCCCCCDGGIGMDANVEDDVDVEPGKIQVRRSGAEGAETELQSTVLASMVGADGNATMRSMDEKKSR